MRLIRQALLLVGLEVPWVAWLLGLGWLLWIVGMPRPEGLSIDEVHLVAARPEPELLAAVDRQNHGWAGWITRVEVVGHATEGVCTVFVPVEGLRAARWEVQGEPGCTQGAVETIVQSARRSLVFDPKELRARLGDDLPRDQLLNGVLWPFVWGVRLLGWSLWAVAFGLGWGMPARPDAETLMLGASWRARRLVLVVFGPLIPVLLVAGMVPLPLTVLGRVSGIAWIAGLAGMATRGLLGDRWRWAALLLIAGALLPLPVFGAWSAAGMPLVLHAVAAVGLVVASLYKAGR